MSVIPLGADGRFPEEKLKARRCALDAIVGADTVGSYNGQGSAEAFAARTFALVVGNVETHFITAAPATCTARRSSPRG
ncbi:hypothetical protein GCM10020367_54920 [Streptomyces sannanensis]|uniref:Uncharacterized protein n=1 Tax=Streptomyces sannanensis TaxID=285536 RepID=A0ABP6SJX5_9ACTN